MTTEYTNADAQQPLIPEQQEALDEVEEVVSNPFTRAVARRLIDENQISFTIPDTFTYIEHRPWGSGVFSPFKSLENVIIPKSITSLGAHSFHFCSALATINLPNSITSIGSHAFRGATALESIHLPDSITSIERCTFFHCTALSTITVPDSITHIGASAFLGLSSLKSITIPDAALNNPNYGMYKGTYYDPFFGCTELITIAQTFNMTDKEYLPHLNKVKEDRIRLRVWVLICLKRINDKRISDREEGKRRKLNDAGSSSSSSGGGGGEVGGELVYVWEQGFNGVLAEDKITAFEMWREMLMFL